MDYLTTLGVSIGIVVGLIAIFGGIYKMSIWVYQIHQSLTQNNGGSTTKDKLENIERTIDVAVVLLQAHESRIKKLEESSRV